MNKMKRLLRQGFGVREALAWMCVIQARARSRNSRPEKSHAGYGVGPFTAGMRRRPAAKVELSHRDERSVMRSLVPVPANPWRLIVLEGQTVRDGVSRAYGLARLHTETRRVSTAVSSYTCFRSAIFTTRTTRRSPSTM
jgi:hypothetical protein